MIQRKTLKDLNLLDRFLFAEAMSDPENMKNVLEIILGEEIVLAHLPQSEKEQATTPAYRGIRLDVWGQDTNGRVYDAETQKRNTYNLPKRSRYYQGTIDSRLLEPGVIDFNQINDVFIIIITPFDLFGEDRYVYTFDMRCREDPELTLNDGAVRIFLNCHGKNKDEVRPELVELLRYMENSTDQVADQCSSEKVQKIHKNIQKIRSSEEVSVRYMQAWEEKILEQQEARTKGHSEGLAEGLAAGLAEGLATGLAEGRQEISRMIQFLIQNGREDEIPRAVSDPEFQERLLKELKS